MRFYIIIGIVITAVCLGMTMLAALSGEVALAVGFAAWALFWQREVHRDLGR